ncbi:platelet-activating factor acetylhydrolase IB subunit [Rubritalea spongiae]|uniref:Platelet-activating factor acetylhydrolase IB subunit n=1 Tax=Rubritalea spongiae TaxID=430797 RepID=A0ABW5E5G0_9BACT
MKYLAIALSLLSLPLCAETDSSLSTTPESRTQKWWMPRHQEKLEQKKNLGDVQLVFIGDSITHAWENKGKEVWAKEYAPYKALNLGYSGDRTENVLWRIENGEVDGISPKAIVMMIGTNNAGHRDEPSEQTADGIKAILDLLEKKQPETKILLLGIFPRGTTPEDPKRKLIDGTNKIIETYADNKRVFYLNINNVFLEEDGTLSKQVMKDLLHPNPDQYQVWADAIRPLLQKLME